MTTQTSAKFKISNNKKMFKVLSSQLYTNKPVAIVRELSCNALDAHTSIGQTKPFNISVTYGAFNLIDFGPGLSHEQMMKLYPTYGGSTKEDTIDTVGGLGLGSKTPLSLVKEFTVISTQKYKSNTYKVHLSDDEPCIDLLHTKDSNIESGMEINVPLPSGYKYEFENAIKRVLKYFPDTSYKTSVIIPIRKYSIFPNEHFGVTNESESTKLIMGPVAYNVSSQEMPADMAKEFMGILSIRGLEIYVPNCFLEVAASRERLSYDEESIKKLKIILEKIKNSITDYVNEDIEKAPDYYSAQCKLSQLNSEIEKLIKNVTITWRNRKVTSKITLVSLLNNIKGFTAVTRNDLNRKVMKVSWKSTLNMHPFAFNYKKPTIIFRDSYKIPFNKTVWHNKAKLKANTILCRGDLLDLYAACDAFDIDKTAKGSLAEGGVVNLSDLEQVPKKISISTVSGKKVTRVKKEIQLLDYRVYPAYPSYLKEVETDKLAYKTLDAQKYAYILSSRSSLIDGIDSVPKNLFLNFCKKLGSENIRQLATFNIIAIPKTHINVIKTNSIVHVNTRIESLIQIAIQEPALNKLIALNSITLKNTKWLIHLFKNIKLNNKESSLEIKYIKLIDFFQKYSMYKTFIDRLEITPTVDSINYIMQIENLLTAFIKKYPLINNISKNLDNDITLMALEDYFRIKNIVPSALVAKNKG